MRLISKLVLKIGSRPDQPPLELTPTGITLFVGPNNSGKSLVLREIEKFCALNTNSKNHIVERVEFSFPDPGTIERDISASKTAPNQNENVPQGHILVQRLNTYPGLKAREMVPLGNVRDWITNNDVGSLVRHYISLLTIRLDGATRTTLLNPANRSDLLEPPTNLLSALFVDSDARGRIRTITSGAFSKHFVIDALHVGCCRSRRHRPKLLKLPQTVSDLHTPAWNAYA